MDLQTQTHADGVLVIQYQAENLDASNAHAFKETVQGMLCGHARVVLDMSQLKFVDSSGLGALISCLRERQAQHGDFRLAAMPKPVSALFDLMRMQRIFSIHDTVEAAVGSYV